MIAALPLSVLHFYLLTVLAERSPERKSWAVVRPGIDRVCVSKKGKEATWLLTTLMNTMVAGLIFEEMGMEMNRPRVMKPQKRLGR